MRKPVDASDAPIQSPSLPTLRRAVFSVNLTSRFNGKPAGSWRTSAAR
jgi:hypothetical protein